ncbi:MAG: hypothetical protein JNK04_23770, partial [Myxococcales bacterium]|nr:hypothetical protein [Myxococcales bacterium]
MTKRQEIVGALRQNRALAIGGALVLLVGSFLGFVPAFGGPGYEVALVYGILLPSITSVAVAFDLVRATRTPFDQLSRGAASGAVFFGMGLVLTLLHGLRTGFCDPWSGLEVMLLGPGLGCVLAGATGAIASEIARPLEAGRRRSLSLVALALLLPLGCIAFSVGRFYSSPMIFAYDPFVGYFSGSIYDTVLDYDRLFTYRYGTAGTLLALVVLALHLDRRDDGRPKLRWIGRPGVAALGLLGLVVSVTMVARGTSYSHFHTRASIEEELGARLEGERCIVVYARSLPLADMKLFLGECEAHIVENEAWWGARGPEKITAFVFEDETQKGRLMGAAGTNIAKPWRAEIYVENAGFPHRVIGHELMHVIASSDGRGPFQVATNLGALLPNPGLIEGVAVAASPKDDDLSPIEWARVMKDLGILPPLSRLFGLSFIGENSSMAYTVSGAFVGFVHERYGADAVRAWYHGVPLETAAGRSMADLESEFVAELDRLSLPEAAAIQGKAKFDRPGFFARKCPRFVDGCRERAGSLAGAGDFDGALRELQKARALEPENPTLRFEEAEIELHKSDDVGPMTALAAEESVPRFARDKALETLADHALGTGDGATAAKIYRELIERTLDESKLRTLYVKLAGATDSALRRPIALLLVGENDKKPDRALAFSLLGPLDRDRPEDGLTAYLFGRYLWEQSDYPAAIRELER